MRLAKAFAQVEAFVAPWSSQDATDVAQDAPASLARLWRAAAAALRYAAAHAGRPISCGRRCSACCRGEILVTPQEAAEIAKRLSPTQALAVRTAPRLTNRRPCPLLTVDGECGIYSVRPMSCRVHHATSPAAQCADVDGEHEFIANTALIAVQVMGSIEGVGELVRAVRAELEAPGRAKAIAEPINVYKPHNDGAYDGRHEAVGLLRHATSGFEGIRVAGAAPSGGEHRAAPPRPHDPKRSSALVERHTTHPEDSSTTVALDAARLRGPPSVPRR